MSTPPELVLFFGRLHPLAVHLPIALLLLVALLEAMSRLPKFRHVNASSGVILAVAVPAAVLSAVCGWLLSLGGGYEDQLLKWHKWTGIVTAALCVVAALLYRLDLRKPYRWSVFLGCAVLLVASHFGGSLTHGSDYLVRYAPAPLKQWLSSTTTPPGPQRQTEPAKNDLFAAVVQPILQQNCVACHVPDKSKGGLRLDSFEAILKGGENGPVVVPGKAGEGLLVQRLRLPLSHEDHMPPEGKPQPSAGDIALLEWWIQNGAPQAKPVSELQASAVVTRALHERLGLPAPVQKIVSPEPLERVLPVAEKLAAELNLFVAPIAAGEPWLQCNASLAGTNFGDAALARLAEIGRNLRWLDLGGTGITDSGLAVLQAMPGLARLHLERTAVTDAGLNHLTSLPQLRYLNLYHTQVSDTGLEPLKSLETLRQLYLWDTKVTPEGAKALVEARTDTGQIDKWRAEIDQLNARIREAHFLADIGGTPAAEPATNASPINAECPVSGKAVDRSKTLIRDGRLIAFCCDDCKAKFERDPAAYLAKLPPLMPKETKVETAK